MCLLNSSPTQTLCSMSTSHVPSRVHSASSGPMWLYPSSQTKRHSVSTGTSSDAHNGGEMVACWAVVTSPAQLGFLHTGISLSHSPSELQVIYLLPFSLYGYSQSNVATELRKSLQVCDIKIPFLGTVNTGH